MFQSRPLVDFFFFARIHSSDLQGDGREDTGSEFVKLQNQMFAPLALYSLKYPGRLQLHWELLLRCLFIFSLFCFFHIVVGNSTSIKPTLSSNTAIFCRREVQVSFLNKPPVLREQHLGLTLTFYSNKLLKKQLNTRLKIE